MKIDLTEWEIMVLRAALVRHSREAASREHRDACRAIEKKTRTGDRPDKIINRIGAKG
jgi:hypothetical protein